jgi:hypothetical protein
MVIFMKENGLITQLMVKGNIIMQMELNMKDNGLEINNLEKELKLGQMALNTMEIISKAKDVGKVNGIWSIEHYILEIFIRMIFMVMESIYGPMVENMSVNGRLIK